MNGAAIGSLVAGLYYGGSALASRTLDFCNKSSQFLKRLNSYPKIKPNTGLSFNNKAYSWIDVRKSITKDITKPLGRGSTGRTVAKNWKERKAMMEIMRNPKLGTEITMKKGMTDKRWHMNEGWVKIARNIDGVEIHWVRNNRTSQVDDFKFKN